MAKEGANPKLDNSILSLLDTISKFEKLFILFNSTFWIFSTSWVLVSIANAEMGSSVSSSNNCFLAEVCLIKLKSSLLIEELLLIWSDLGDIKSIE